ncbi:hypothetical protein ACOMHN_064159 [Nucella lapillus]
MNNRNQGAGAGIEDIEKSKETEGEGENKPRRRDFDEVDHRHDRGKLLESFSGMREEIETEHPPITMHTGCFRTFC